MAYLIGRRVKMCHATNVLWLLSRIREKTCQKVAEQLCARSAVCKCFNTLPKCVQELLAGSNRLRAVAVDYFDCTPALKCVDLSHNQLELVPESLLKLINLERLNLDNNDLVE